MGWSWGEVMQRRVVVTGVGLVTPLSACRAGSWRRILAGESGVGTVRAFDADGLPSRVAAQVPRVGETDVCARRGLGAEEVFDAAEALEVSAAEAAKVRLSVRRIHAFAFARSPPPQGAGAGSRRQGL